MCVPFARDPLVLDFTLDVFLVRTRANELREIELNPHFPVNLNLRNSIGLRAILECLPSSCAPIDDAKIIPPYHVARESSQSRRVRDVRRVSERKIGAGVTRAR